MAAERNVGLGLIVGAARSGTTLMRLILDAHPEIGCPAEAGLPALMSHMIRVWGTVDADIRQAVDVGDPGERRREGPGAAEVAREVDVTEQAEQDHRDSSSDLPQEAQLWVRTAMLTVMERYCARGGKRLYVDKSLDSVHHLRLVDELFPQTRCVLAFRHVMDTVASGIEASPWGFQAYGYGPYVQTSPGNTVAALANYWLDHVDRALHWEHEHPDTCLRVRYEDLVLTPEPVIASVLRFLRVADDLSVLHKAFDRDPARGPGDYKVEHTSRVHAASIGRGKRVPVGMLSPALLEAINEKLVILGYEPLDQSWNSVERPVDGIDTSVWSSQLSAFMAKARINQQVAEFGPFAILAEDHHALRWVVHPEKATVIQGDGDVEGVLTGTAEDLVLMLSGQENLGVLLRSGRIRHLLAEPDDAKQRDLRRDVARIVALLRGDD